MRSLFLLVLCVPSFAAPPDGEALYKERCAGCHNGPQQPRMPGLEQLRQSPPEQLWRVMSQGAMVPQSAGLTDPQIRAIARYVAGRDFAVTVTGGESAGRCTAVKPFRPSPDDWNGWGREPSNLHYQPKPGFDAAAVPKLKVKWAFGFPGAVTLTSQPTVAGGRVFTASYTGDVYSLDAESGCTYWKFTAATSVRHALSVGRIGNRWALFFGDTQSNAYAVDVQTGKEIWNVNVDDHPVSRITGAPTFHEGRLYVPVSSLEEPAAMAPSYECCTFRGNVVALDGATGKQIWKAYAIPDPPKPYRKNSAGTQMHGPAGAAIWSSPTIDAKRKLVYVATGNSYTEVSTPYANAVIAFDLETGSMKWANQATPNDNFTMACGKPGVNNCPENRGPDFDFGTSPVLVRTDSGKDVVVAAQKSAMVYGLDPDNRGKTLWATKVGQGGALGGVEWGHVSDNTAVYAAVSDLFRYSEGKKPGGIAALRPLTGQLLWRTDAPELDCKDPRQPGCTGAQSAAVTVIPGIVFSGSIDGHFRAYDTKTGNIVWDFDTKREFPTANAVPGRGGSIDYGAATVAGGRVYLNSGSAQWQGIGGNVLICLTVDGK